MDLMKIWHGKNENEETQKSTTFDNCPISFGACTLRDPQSDSATICVYVSIIHCRVIAQQAYCVDLIAACY